jgi:Cu(I)/Ag(I) efflux system membrane fusion protein
MSLVTRRNVIRSFIAVCALSLFSASIFAADDKKPAAQGQVDSIVKSYLVVQKVLAADKTEGVSDELAKIHTAAAALAESSDGKLKEQAKALAGHSDVKVKDLKGARASFKPLSADVIALVQIMPQSAEIAPELYDVNCPMVRANWLQTSKDVANPYMGSQMLDCGKVEKKIASADKK